MDPTSNLARRDKEEASPESNPGPRAHKARIIVLDVEATLIDKTIYHNDKLIFVHVLLGVLHHPGVA